MNSKLKIIQEIKNMILKARSPRMGKDTSIDLSFLDQMLNELVVIIKDDENSMKSIEDVNNFAEELSEGLIDLENNGEAGSMDWLLKSEKLSVVEWVLGL